MVSCAARPSRARSSADSARRVTLSTIPGASAGFTTNPLRSEEHTSELQSPCNLVCRIIRSEEHTSELQSPCNLVCRLLLEKKKSAGFRNLRQGCFVDEDLPDRDTYSLRSSASAELHLTTFSWIASAYPNSTPCDVRG